MTISYKKTKLRYGENPNQKAYLLQNKKKSIFEYQISGKMISYNNIIDVDSGLKCLNEFKEPTSIIIKHTNPCGVASSKDIYQAFYKSFESDRKSAFGGVIFLNRKVNLKLANSSNIEKVNNYRYKKWYLVSFGNTSGYIFSDFVNIVEDTTWLKRYRHVESTNWSKDKTKLQKNIEITIERDDSNNEYLLKGFAWDYSQGYQEITIKFLINPEVIGTFNDDDLKIFFFDEKEIYVESNDSVFTGIYKKY